MRSLLMMTLFLTACGGRQRAAETSEPDFDPELYEACTPDWQEPPPAVCERSENGEDWKITAGPALHQVIAMIDDRTWEKAGPSMMQAVIQLLDPVIQYEKDTPCALQVAHWYRGRAHLALGHDREAFLDFASIVRAGPGHPYYDEVEGALDLMAPRLPASVVQICDANYVHVEADAAVKGKGEHWRTYTPDDPAP